MLVPFPVPATPATQSETVPDPAAGATQSKSHVVESAFPGEFPIAVWLMYFRAGLLVLIWIWVSAPREIRESAFP